MPVTKVSTTQFNGFRINDYNTLILVSGGYNMLGESAVTKIKNWVQQGGTLVLVRNAVSWAIQNKLVDEQVKKYDEKKETVRLDFEDAPNYQGSRVIGGSIFMTDLDITHPLGFGYTSRSLPVCQIGQGRAVLFLDDPNFRGYWYGTSKLFFNALFFGSHIGTPSFDQEH
jgi:hypothetical protein